MPQLKQIGALIGPSLKRIAAESETAPTPALVIDRPYDDFLSGSTNTNNLEEPVRHQPRLLPRTSTPTPITSMANREILKARDSGFNAWPGRLRL